MKVPISILRVEILVPNYFGSEQNVTHYNSHCHCIVHSLFNHVLFRTFCLYVFWPFSFFHLSSLIFSTLAFMGFFSYVRCSTLSLNFSGISFKFALLTVRIHYWRYYCFLAYYICTIIWLRDNRLSTSWNLGTYGTYQKMSYDQTLRRMFFQIWILYLRYHKEATSWSWLASIGLTVWTNMVAGPDGCVSKPRPAAEHLYTLWTMPSSVYGAATIPRHTPVLIDFESVCECAFTATYPFIIPF